MSYEIFQPPSPATLAAEPTALSQIGDKKKGHATPMFAYSPLLIIAETLILYASLWAAAAIRFGGDLGAANASIGALEPRATLFAVIGIVALLSVGLYRTRQNLRSIDTIVRFIAAFALIALADAVVYYLLPSLSTGRGTQALALVIGFVGVLVTRAAFHSVVGGDHFKRNVLVCGHGITAAALARSCGVTVQRGFRIVGYLGVLGDKASADCVPLVPLPGSLAALVRERKIDEIVVALDNRRNTLPAHQLLECRLSGVKVSEVLTFMERETGRIDLDALYPSWFIFSNGFRQGVLHRLLKRLFDIVMSMLLLVIAVPLLVLAATAILIESRGRGGVFLRQARIGQRGEIFQMLKLRSMIPQAEDDGHARWASVNDPRVTRVGALLRRFRIDELPQIINILRGEMSFVGPRPERPEFVDLLSRKIPYYRERHCVKPGLTGWAQLCYPYGSSVEDARQKLQYDLFYVKNHSPVLDLLILLETFDVVIWGKARFVPVGEERQEEHEKERRIA